MTKAKPRSSWLPKGRGRSIEPKATTLDASGEMRVNRDSSKFEGAGRAHLDSESVLKRSGVTGQYHLPNGDVIKSVRKDVMDRALGRADSKRK